MPPILKPGTVNQTPASKAGAPRIGPVRPDTPQGQVQSWFDRVLEGMNSVELPLLGQLGDVVRTYTEGTPDTVLADLGGPMAVVGRRGLGKVVSGSLAELGSKRIPNPIVAHHGSPHDFNAERLIRHADGRTEYIVGRPDVLPDVPQGATVVQDFPLGRQRMDKIGTGEGAQAYGHGLYQAEQEGVARGYKKAGPEADRQYDAINKKLGELAKEMDKLSPSGYRRWTDPKRGKELADEYDRLLESKEKVGKMYEVNLHVTPDELLDWDKPLSEQPQKVREALNTLWTEKGGTLEGRTYPPFAAHSGADGSSAHAAIGVTFGKGRDSELAKAAAEKLREKGIKGIQYLDQGSRAVPAELSNLRQVAARMTEGADKRLVQKRITELEKMSPPQTRNFVIFDDELIEIAKKYGIPLATLSAAWKAKGGTVEKRGGA